MVATPASLLEPETDCDITLAARNRGVELHYAFGFTRALARSEIERVARSTPYQLLNGID